MNMKQRSPRWAEGAQLPVWHGNEPKKTGARSARARTRGQNPLVYEKRVGPGAGSGSAPMTNGSGYGSGRPKNIRIRIPNTVSLSLLVFLNSVCKQWLLG